MSNKPVYVVLAVFKPDLRFLDEQLSSIAAQTYANVTVFFVVADCVSAKDCRRLAKKYDLSFELVEPKHTTNSVYSFELGIHTIVSHKYDLDNYYIALCDQDDIWSPKKLQVCVGILEKTGCGLVHSDATLIDESGRQTHDSMFAVENRHKSSSTRDLLYRNNITGMTAVFTGRLAALSLPFPQQNGLLYHHDLWLGLVASVTAGIQFSDEKLVQYRQHGNNAVGAILKSKKKKSANLRQAVLGKVLSHYLATYLAKKLYMRITEATAVEGNQVNQAQLKTLRPFLAVTGGSFPFLKDAFGWLLRGKTAMSKIALDGFVSRMARKAWAIKQLFPGYYLTALADFDRIIFQKVPGVQPAQQSTSKEIVAVEAPALKTDWKGYLDPRKRARWQTKIDKKQQPSLVLLVPTLNPTEIFAGIATAIEFGVGLASAGHKVKFVSTDLELASPAASLAYITGKLSNSALSKNVSVHCGVTTKTIAFNENDVFFATAWWSAHVAWKQTRDYGFKQKKFFYLIQDFEPNFYPWDDNYAGALQSYELPCIPVFNTNLLQSFFASQGVKFKDRTSIAFGPAIDMGLFGQLESKRNKQKRRIAVYGRPEVPRNLFPTTVESLGRFIEKNNLSTDEVEFISVGLSHPDIKLPNGHVLVSNGKLSWEGYLDFLKTVDIGFALMLSPHPSHLPLEMAAAGARVVTNSFATKDLSEVSKSIISSQPEPELLCEALSGAWAQVMKREATDEERRVDLKKLGIPVNTAINRVSKKLKTLQSK